MTDKFDIRPLSRELATASAARIAELLNLIPAVSHTEADVLAESKRSIELVDKWRLSLTASINGDPIGVLLSYRRGIEEPHYPHASVYLAGLAVDPRVQRQGVGAALMKAWLEIVDRGETLSLQTNSASFNQGVITFYESFGFVTSGLKNYDNRTDLVMSATYEKAENAIQAFSVRSAHRPATTEAFDR